MRRNGDGMRFVPRSHPRIGIQLLSALRRGEVVALQGDRAIGTRGDVAIPFFGRPAFFPLGPFLLARAAGVPVVPAFCVLGAGYRYTVRLAPPISVERGDEEGAARVWVRLLEDIVREPDAVGHFFDCGRLTAFVAGPRERARARRSRERTPVPHVTLLRPASVAPLFGRVNPLRLPLDGSARSRAGLRE